MTWKRIFSTQRLLAIAFLAAALTSTGCLVGPDHCDPGAPFLPHWSRPLPDGVSDAPNDSVAWWTKFNDPVLSEMMVRTAQSNLTLGQAYERIAQARARRAIARGGLFPDYYMDASYSRVKSSGNGSPFGLTFNTPAFNYWSASLVDASWEIDVFGGVRRNLQAANADIDVAIEDHNAVLVSLQGEVGANYVQARTLQHRILIAQRNVQLQRQSLQIAETKLEAGTVSKLDVYQARSNLYSTESNIPTLRQNLDLSYNRLAVLQGMPPQDLTNEVMGARQLFKIPDHIAVGLPIDLIRQRPDIRSAERQLAAQSARIGVATSDLFPKFTLTGTFGVNATHINQWFTTESIAYNFGPTARWNVLSFGRVWGDIEFQRARWRELVYAYQQTVLDASEEVENALISYRFTQVRAEELRKAVEAAQGASQISEVQYEGGIIPFQTLLDAQRFQADLEDQYVAARGDTYLSLINLYKALGGGWQEPFAFGSIDEAAGVPGELQLDPQATLPGPNAPGANPLNPVNPVPPGEPVPPPMVIPAPMNN
ncbi:efflux transporter outer membrane subunit [Blastopirellula sp. JC732]|uniref:Efflux transporter outer membrane subunit n=1 Tax=Blastopirellula sediminis TaxID=2894196 RepID=A0A9X1MJV2_9BACT|nr:efflux transporter outer membrane subunit [Blastopirellula sediminis]MCC9608790.1 efflux transporter outer membrane subunit [Blastopirellula sediminis]MCC9628433.1 efflux transporter outer membrane subunit [Blastopirellula sediminis]